MKKKIFKALTYVNVFIFSLSVCAIDSESMVPMAVAAFSGLLIFVFLAAEEGAKNES